jgi:hypothetical protein
MSKYDLETEEGRTEYLINLRKRNIKEFEFILQGKHPNYKKYEEDSVFMNDVKRHLEIEKNLLKDLLEDE